MKKLISTILIVAGIGVCPVLAQNSESSATAQIQAQVAAEVEANPEDVLSIVSRLTSANPTQAAAIVGAAIQAVNASDALVGQIVEVAGTIVPVSINEIAESAFAASPSSAAEIVAASNRVGATQGVDVVFNPREEVNPEGATEVLDFADPQVALGGGFQPGEFPGSVNEKGVEAEADQVTNPNP